MNKPLRKKEIIEQISLIQKYIISENIFLKLVLSTIVSLIFAFFIKKYVWTIPILVWLIFKLRIEFNPKKIKAIKLLDKAKKYVKSNQLEQAIMLIIQANNLVNSLQITELLKKLTNNDKFQELYEIQIIQQKLNSIKDPKLKQIFTELLNVLNFIYQHKQQLSQLEQKQSQLKTELINAPETYKDELNQLITRYDNLIKLEKSKIEFYLQLKDELNQLYKNYIYQNKIQQEYEFLNQLESSYLSNSIKEDIEADSKTDFVDYQNAYLKALAETANQVNSTQNQDLFEEIRNNFKQKKQQLLNNQN